MKKLISISVTLGILLASSAAFAQDDTVKEIVFDDDRIEGDLMMPTSTTVNVKELDELSSLIRAREDFVDEMRKTVDEL
ncbi:MAG: hypothetical protein IIY06_08360 [Proteobacteria bacterium]|jgi:hypothetical protein|nr:hypothetical protein [Pseudomonadota bacterium]